MEDNQEAGILEEPKSTRNWATNVQVKPNVYQDKLSCFLIKASVNAAMKNNIYTVYVHLNHKNGEILYNNCTCQSGNRDSVNILLHYCFK